MRPLILFDMDGTLLNSVPAIGESCNRALAENGLPQHPIPAYNGMVGNGMRVLIGRACPAGAAEELRQKVLASYDRIYTEECRKPGIIYPGIPQLLQRLRAQGVLTAVITNKPQPQADALRESTFHGMLDAIWGQREGFPLKPDPTLAQELIRELEARPVAYVGDSQVDISLGKNLGLPTVLMTWGSRTPAELLAADPSAILADTAAQLEARLEQYLANLQ